MADQMSGKPNQESAEKLVPTAIAVDPSELADIAALDAPIWEEIADIDYDLAKITEAKSGDDTRATPDWNVVDDVAASVGLEVSNGEILHTNEILEHRDADRWELNPQSAEDHQKHRSNEN
jgi:Family of unknown function (DUF6335)